MRTASLLSLNEGIQFLVGDPWAYRDPDGKEAVVWCRDGGILPSETLEVKGRQPNRLSRRTMGRKGNGWANINEFYPGIQMKLNCFSWQITGDRLQEWALISWRQMRRAYTVGSRPLCIKKSGVSNRSNTFILNTFSYSFNAWLNRECSLHDVYSENFLGGGLTSGLQQMKLHIQMHASHKRHW